MIHTLEAPSQPKPSSPVLSLLNPRETTKWFALTVPIGLLCGAFGITFMKFPLWAAVLALLVAVMPALVIKWRADGMKYGKRIMLISILLTAQGLHSVEHIAQWAEYHVFNFTLRQSNGLLSPANAEWVHFVWNWVVLFAIIAIIASGMRNIWAWILLFVAVTHTIEHSYSFIRYLQILSELGSMGVTNISAQGLPGILGRDGWLARSPLTQGTIWCGIPGLTTAERLDLHFWWNVIEMTFTVLASHVYLSAKFKVQSSK